MVLIGGRERREIVLSEADPSWPDRFEAEATRIGTALGDRAVAIDHIGSTSVPGLAAKPIIDMDLSVEDPNDEDAYLADLLAAGYELRVREPGHLMVRTPELDVHVHICAPGSEWSRRHLLFRDHLRAHPADRELYEALKRDLVTREWDDMNDYAGAKSEVVTAILERAEAWAERTGWAPEAGAR